MREDLNTLVQRWGMALQSAGFGVWDLDPRREIVHYSPEWKAMLGYSSEDVPDATATWRDRVHPDDLQPMIAALFGHLEGRDPRYEMEFRLRDADGAYRWVLSRGRVVDRDAQGQALRMIGTLTDLSARREAESLRTARDRAEAANLAKTEFLSRMSHELRTPLNAVLGFAQLLSARIGSTDVEAQRRYVSQIEKAGWHLLAMIDNVLDLSAIESGQAQMQLRAVALAPLLQTVIEAMGPLAQKRAIDIRPSTAPSDASVLADPKRLTQALTNILSNAIKFNRAGGTVTCAVTPCQAGWRVAVSDTGCGMAPEQIAHLFEPFNRLGRTGSAVEGSGVGLLLTQRLLDKMSGHLAVHSTLGVGSTFEITLPAPGAGAAPTAATRILPLDEPGPASREEVKP